MKVVELVGLGPGPFCGMLLADLGAEVLRVDRLADAKAADTSVPAGNAMHRGKRSIALDLKQPDAVETFLRLTDRADGVIEVFRPGVAERLGIGPEVCLARNPRLVYGRLTGWGQDGPMAARAGHDIDYIALCGALEPLGRADQPPTPPINILGDFAGGGMLLAFGMVSAWVARATTGAGQVVDAAMVDGAAIMLIPFFAGIANGGWGPRGTNIIDTGAPFYDVYATSDSKWVAVGAIEPQFYAALLHTLGIPLDDPLLGSAHQHDKAKWAQQKEAFARLFAARARDEWETIFESIDACVAPVLDPIEASRHPHAAARNQFRVVNGAPQPMPAPRFSGTPAEEPGGTVHAGADGDSLGDWGFDGDEIARLRSAGALA